MRSLADDEKVIQVRLGVLRFHSGLTEIYISFRGYLMSLKVKVTAGQAKLSDYHLKSTASN